MLHFLWAWLWPLLFKKVLEEQGFQELCSNDSFCFCCCCWGKFAAGMMLCTLMLTQVVSQTVKLSWSPGQLWFLSHLSPYHMVPAHLRSCNFSWTQRRCCSWNFPRLGLCQSPLVPTLTFLRSRWQGKNTCPAPMGCSTLTKPDVASCEGVSCNHVVMQWFEGWTKSWLVWLLLGARALKHCLKPR